MFFSGKKYPHKPACMVIHVVVGILQFIVAIAATIGVYKAHYVLLEGASRPQWVFGSLTGSLAILAFSVTAMIFIKQCKMCMAKCEVCYPGK